MKKTNHVKRAVSPTVHTNLDHRPSLIMPRSGVKKYLNKRSKAKLDCSSQRLESLASYRFTSFRIVYCTVFPGNQSDEIRYSGRLTAKSRYLNLTKLTSEYLTRFSSLSRIRLSASGSFICLSEAKDKKRPGKSSRAH